MATLSHAESRRLYSWWWDSHISPKHSKWLQDNLSDMDNKIKGMIRLIEEDADSFAQRAEMYYKKRPELTKLVEEFYRAYRALAERYDHATGALRQAHRTIAEVFPNQIPSEFCDESPDGCPDPDAGINNPEMPQGILNSDGLHHNLLGFSFHHEAMKLNEAYLDETKVTPNEAYLKQLSEMFVTREDATGPNFVEGREGKYSEYKLLQQEISRLSKETQDLKKQVASESARADKNEKEVQHLKETCSKEKSEKQNALTQYLDSMERVSYLEDEISRTKADLQKLNDEMLIRASCLNSAKEQSLILEKANQSLRLELDILKQKIREQQEELNKKGQDLEILNISLQVEHQKNMKAEMACQSIEKQHTESQEEMKHLKQDIISGVEKLKDVEEELQKIREENARLSSKKLSSALKIMNLQDEIISLIDLKRKLEDEADLHIEEKEVLQLELCRLKKDRNDLEQKYHALREEIQAVNLSVESLQALIKELKDRNLDLKGTIKKNQDEKLIYLENLNHMRTMSEKNAILEASLLDANGELERLRMKIKELEDSSDHLRYRISIHLAEKAALISHMEASAQNMEKLLKKNAFLENSLSDMNVELEGWRTKLKGVQESCKSLHDEKSCLLNEKYTLINQVESIKQSLENLEGRYCDLEDKNLNLERQKDSTLHHVAELQELLRLEKKDNSTLIHSSKSQLSTLANQICLLQEEGQQREEDLETEQHKIMDAQIEIFIFRRCLCDMKEENLILSVGSQKHQEALRCTEKLILELERECLIQEKKIKSLTEHNEKLREWIHLIIKSLKIDLQYISLDDTKDELLLQLVLLEIRQMLHTISEAQDEKQHLLLEKSVVVTLLEQLGKYVSDLRAEKTSLERESKIRLEEFTLLKNKNDEFLEVNKELRKEMQASNQREEALRAEVDLLFRQLTYLQEVDSTLQIKISKMLEENNLISKKIHDLSQEKVKLEEVNNVILTEVMALDYLSVMFKSLNSERACELKLLTNETEYLYKVKNKLEQEIRPINENIVLDVSEAKVREEMEKKISILLEDCSCKENEIECLCQENKVLKCEVSKLLKDVEELRSRDENLNSELQKKIGEVKSSDVVITSLLCDIQFETINATVFKEKVLELIKTCENLESRAIVRKEVLQEEIKLRNLTINKLEKKIYVLEEENGGLRADFNAYAHDLGSLWDDIAILEELTLSLAGRHSTSINQTKEDDQVEPYPCNPSNREPGQDYNTTASTRLLKLQHLHDRVKVLQEVVMNTGSILELERFDSNASLESAWKEIEGLKSKGIPDNEMTKSKYEQIMKDIQLDIVLNSSRHGNGILSHGRRKSRKTDETTDQILELWGTAKGYDSQKQKGALAVENNMTHYQIEEEGIYSSGELVAEKEVGVDKLDLHKKVVPHQEWNRRVIERLFSDSQRLLVLQASVHELQKNIETSEKISRPSRSEFNAIKLQLKETEGSISDLIHVNSKLTSKVEDLSASPHNRFEEKEETDNGSKRWKQISDWARKVSEKIGRLELEMPKIQYSLLKFEEEHMNKRTRVVKRRSGIRLREYIYGRRNSRRQREDYSCGCMRPTTTSD